MIYKAVEVIWIFLAGGRDGTDGRTGIEGSIRGPHGPKNGEEMVKMLKTVKNGEKYCITIFVPSLPLVGISPPAGHHYMHYRPRSNLISDSRSNSRSYLISDPRSDLGYTNTNAKLTYSPQGLFQLC